MGIVAIFKDPTERRTRGRGVCDNCERVASRGRRRSHYPDSAVVLSEHRELIHT